MVLRAPLLGAYSSVPACSDMSAAAHTAVHSQHSLGHAQVRLHCHPKQQGGRCGRKISNLGIKVPAAAPGVAASPVTSGRNSDLHSFHIRFQKSTHRLIQSFSASLGHRCATVKARVPDQRPEGTAARCAGVLHFSTSSVNEHSTPEFKRNARDYHFGLLQRSRWRRDSHGQQNSAIERGERPAAPSLLAERDAQLRGHRLDPGVTNVVLHDEPTFVR